MWIKTMPAYLLALYLPASVAEECNASILTLKPVLSANTYDVFSSASYPLKSQYELSTSIPEDCSVDVVIEVDDGASALKNHNLAEMRFEYYAQTGRLEAGKWRFTLDSQQQNIVFELRFPNAQWLEAAEYSGMLKAILYQENSVMEQDQSELRIATKVVPSARIQFYGLTQRHYNLDLGSLKTNKIINYAPRLWVESTAPYTLSAESQFNGKLRHQSQNPKWDLDYMMRIASEQIALDGGNSEWRSNVSTEGTPLPIQIIIGNTERKAGGRYSDTVHIHVEPDLSYMP
ncbi:hypothetical protein [Enterovibrio norvegicus]|uniref:Uncharacterized protein n=1 Tax=Enterovibrio norvegicus TaxID=188144 RepID=A0A2N7LAH8_9GAMM|nr:hypothetical protein [Enterovibrio norvegicus]PMN91611.1 hypothetical protein BCT23_17085 [Enterovibrio norvegicus]